MAALLVSILIALVMIGFLYFLDHNPWKASHGQPQKFRGK